MDFIIGISGASGVIYGQRTVQELARAGHGVQLILTPAAAEVFKLEQGLVVDLHKPDLVTFVGAGHERVKVHRLEDISAAMASGTRSCHALAVVPCSMATLAKLANGISDRLLERAVDVFLKERRNVVVVPRESPLHQVHLQNMLTLARLGACILPAMPGFYHKPQSLEDQINFVVSRVLDQLGVPNQLIRRWRGTGDADAPG